MRAAAMLWAQLHEKRGYPAWAMTPYQFVERGVPPGTRVLFLSVSGRHHDMLRAAHVVRDLGRDAHAVIFNSGSPLGAMVRAADPDYGVMHLPEPVQRDSLTTIHSLVSMGVLAAAINEGGGPWAPSFYVQTQTLPVGRPGHVIVLGVGVSQPAAFDFASRCRASGCAPAHSTDLRDFAHGDLMTVGAEDTWLVGFSAGEQYGPMARALACVPPEIPRLHFTTEESGASGALQLMAQSIVGFVELANRLDMDEHGPGKPRWTSKLFFMPIGSEH